MKDANKWEADPERTARGFDGRYYRKLLEKTWEETAFVFMERAFFQEKGRDSIV